jgi:hypothetical protein
VFISYARGDGELFATELRRLEGVWIASDFRLDADALLVASQAGDKFIHPNG